MIRAALGWCATMALWVGIIAGVCLGSLAAWPWLKKFWNCE